ncbi:hypothetical protein ScPMuIL_000141 [Solemya velum]
MFDVQLKEVWHSQSDVPTLLLILTYMRSGSSFLGDIFREGQNTFYVYEPLHGLKTALGHNKTVTFLNETVLNNLTHEHNAYRVIKDWLTCDLEQLDTATLGDVFLRRTQSVSEFQKCKGLTRESFNITKRYKTCIPYLKKICNQNKFRVIKTIRTNMATAKSLMDCLPNLKIIHLIRDPRAVQNSRLRVGAFKFKKALNMTRHLCTAISNDLPIGQQINSAYKGRYMILRYEDLASKPIDMSRKLYNFLGNKFTYSLEKFIFNITLAGNEDGCNICSMRKNSREHIDSWRNFFPLGTVQMIDEECKSFYDTMGYLPVTDREMQENISLPVWIKRPISYSIEDHLQT